MRLLGKGISKVAMSEADKADRQKAAKEKTAQIRYSSNLAEASQQTLVAILLNDPDVVLRRAAVAMVNDLEVLLRVALQETDPEVLRPAIDRLKDDQGALTRIYREAASGWARLRSAGFLTEEAVLEEIMLRDKNDLVRRAAVGKVRDERVLLFLARDRDPFVRESACCVLNNQAALTQVALHDSEEAVRTRAIDRLEDLGTLSNLMRSDRSPEIRMRAAVRISALEKRAQTKERKSETDE